MDGDDGLRDEWEKGRFLNEVEKWNKVVMRPMMEWRFIVLTIVYKDECRTVKDRFWHFFHISHPLSTLSSPLLITTDLLYYCTNSSLYLLDRIILQLILLKRTVRNRRLFRMALWKEKQKPVKYSSLDMIIWIHTFLADLSSRLSNRSPNTKLSFYYREWRGDAVLSWWSFLDRQPQLKTGSPGRLSSNIPPSSAPPTS